jgi:Eco57I restriction-modification methylase/restriction-modification enzyme MmeI-like protein
MSDLDRRFHETWLGMVQPIDGLVVSIPVLVDAQCMERQPPHVQQKFLALCPATKTGDAGPEGFAIADLATFFSELLGFTPDAFDSADALPEPLSLYVPEGRQTLRPTLALKRQTQGGPPYEMLVWDLGVVSSGRGLDLDKPETLTGSWDYPPAAKFDRLLRHCRIPIGLLTNRDVVRLVYAPHGESSGAITFRIDDMASVAARPILDAFIMLLSANRFFGVTEERSLPALLAESRKRQANVTNDLADQVFEALAILLRGFEAAAERDGSVLLEDAISRKGDHLYKGLLTVLLRLVVLLYAEDRGLLPVEEPLYAQHLSVLALFDQLQADRGAYPDSMPRRFGAWGRLVTLFRAIYLGIEHGTLKMPARRGTLFNPHEYPFLEGWGPAGSAPITQPEARAEVRLPTVDDETVLRVLEKLLVLDGQRLSYRALDVEQIGSVYEALMGYHVLRMPAEAVCMRPDRLWLSAEEVLEVPAARRAKWLKETVGLSKAEAEKLSEELKAGDAKTAIEALSKYAAGGKKADPSLAKARAGQLVLQPGAERRRTSSHYTPRSLSAPIVHRTLEPLLAVMGEAPASARILNLKVCDPAMGSGAFLVEACRFLAEEVVAAWTREGKTESIAKEHGEPLLHARRLVAQRCLYGVDKNDAAVELAKLSLWLVTLSKSLPFTFLDHALRNGDSLVGLDFDQIRSFHWKPGKQVELFTKELDAALGEAIALRQRIGDLAFSDSAVDQKEKERLLWDAQDALGRVRLIGDLVVGAFFAHEKDKDREKERDRRLDLVSRWLRVGGAAPDELRGMQDAIRARIPVFHWMLEFPEVFYAERPDPLDKNQVNRAAFMDAFVGNPPFLGGKRISTELGDTLGDWLSDQHDTSKNTDVCVHFFRRTFSLLGDNGSLGLVATNSVSQGDNLMGGLAWILANGGVIFDATRSMPWPGDAAVSISVVHVASGIVSLGLKPVLDGQPCSAISSRLLPTAERPEPTPLRANASKCASGSKVAGQGFFLSSAEREDIVRQDAGSSNRIQAYLGGEELLTSPLQLPDRWVINFGKLSLEEAEKWPRLISIVRETVKPYRQATRLDTGPGGHGKKYWWQYISRCDPLYEAIHPLSRCLAISQVGKHLAFAWQPTNRVFGHTMYIVALESASSFAALQSRIHEAWARLLSSSMRNDLRYTPSDCFESFPFPKPDPRTVIPALEDIGQRLYDFRAKYMIDENVGLTITYNRLKDPACDDARILALRRLHEEMDRAVLDAYGWSDIEVPPYCPSGGEDKKKLEAFEDEVIDRLFVLNAKRAEEEKIKGLGAGGGKKRGAGKKATKAAGDKKTSGKKDGGEDSAQAGLPGMDESEK